MGKRWSWRASALEFVIAMPLLASLRSLNVIFANDKTVTASGVQIDHYIADNLSDLMPDRQQITINAEWFTLDGRWHIAEGDLE